VGAEIWKFSLDEQVADLAFQELSTPIKERFFSQEFDSLAHLMQTAQEI